MNKATEESLDKLHGSLAKELTERITKGEARIELINCDGEVQEHIVMHPVGAPTLSVARQFLKDNHVEADAETNSDFGDLVDSLPFNDKEPIHGEVN